MSERRSLYFSIVFALRARFGRSVGDVFVTVAVRAFAVFVISRRRTSRIDCVRPRSVRVSEFGDGDSSAKRVDLASLQSAFVVVILRGSAAVGAQTIFAISVGKTSRVDSFDVRSRPRVLALEAI